MKRGFVKKDEQGVVVSDFDEFYQRLTHKGLIGSQQELAGMLGVNRSAVTQAKRRGVVPEGWVWKLAKRLGVDPDWLEGGVEGGRLGGEDFAAVPKVQARLCAGGGSFEVEGCVEGYHAFRREWLNRKGDPASMVLMDVFGNSMEPEVREGDTALVDQSQQRVLAGGIYAVGLEDTVMLKRVEKRPGAVVLHSDNPDYAPVVLHGDEAMQARIIGKVVWLGREYR
jgi:SOS-response transcriptional repressor LexA